VTDVARPLRVCIASPSFPPDLGGLGQHVAHFAGGLSEIGCDVTVVTHVPPGGNVVAGETTETAGLHVEKFPVRVGGRRFAFAPRLSQWVRDHRMQFDVVHAFGFHGSVALSLVRKGVQPFFFTPVFHAGGSSRLADIVHVLYDPWARQIFHSAKVVFCGTSAERQSLLEQYAFCESWAVVQYIALDWDSFDVEPFREPSPVILSAGRLERYKRVDRVVQAMALLDEEADLVICGAGPDEKRLQLLREQSPVRERVRILGAVSGDDLRRWQRTAKVVVSLSTHESFGLSLAEGAAAGASLVASDIPPHREMAAAIGVEASWVSTDATVQDIAECLRGALALQRTQALEGASSHPPHRRRWVDVATETLAFYHEGMLSGPHVSQTFEP
jgi:glycosyltransferase involved in cell wall biosynthesis